LKHEREHIPIVP